MTRFDVAALIWGGWFLAFGVLELVPVFWKSAPWTTLSSFTRDLEGKWVWAAFIICVGLWILNAHLTWRFLPKAWHEITG